MGRNNLNDAPKVDGASGGASDTTHHLVYVKRRVGHAPGSATEIEALGLGALDRPVAHIFGHPFLAHRLEQENQQHVLWFVTALAVAALECHSGLTRG
jgi:hypothetical protein